MKDAPVGPPTEPRSGACQIDLQGAYLQGVWSDPGGRVFHADRPHYYSWENLLDGDRAGRRLVPWWRHLLT